MRNLILAIGAGLTAVVYADLLYMLPAMFGCVMLAAMITGTDGIDIDLPAVMGVTEILLLSGALVWHYWQVFAVLAVIAFPIALIDWFFSLGAVPYPRLPRRR